MNGTDSLAVGLRLLTAGAAAIAMAGACAVLVGWAFDLPLLKSLAPDWASMKVNAAIAFGLSGLSLWLQRDENAPHGHRLVGRALAGLVALIALLTLGEHVFNADLGIDQLLIAEHPEAADTSAPGRMGPITALGLLSTGLALGFLDWRTPSGHRPAHALALPPAAFSLLAMAGYLYGAKSLYALPDLTAMSLPSASLLLALSQAVLCARLDGGPFNVLVGRASGSAMVRRLLPLAVFLPLLIGYLRLKGERAGLMDPESATALHTAGNIFVFAGLLWLTAIWLNRADTRRRQAEDAVRALNADLEKRVRARTSELNAQATQLESANAELESFAYSVSHDLRAPLRAIDGFSLALGEDYKDRLDETGRDYLGRIRAAAQRMGQLIDDLLDLSRVNRYAMEVKPVDLTGLVRGCIERLEAEDAGRRIEWQVGEALLAHGDEKLLRIAFENLLSNAFKFTSRRAEVRIEVDRVADADPPTFFVRDNGAGFDMSRATHLFGAFQRLHTHLEFPGTGIGLATVQRVIHRHGGRIRAEAEPEKGATFYLTLPPPSEPTA